MIDILFINVVAGIVGLIVGFIAYCIRAGSDLYSDHYDEDE